MEKWCARPGSRCTSSLYPPRFWPFWPSALIGTRDLSDPLNRFRRCGFMNRRKAVIFSLIIWLYSLLIALLPIMGWRTDEKFVFNSSCYFPFTPIYVTLSSLLNFILPLLMACAIHIKIYHMVCTQLRGFQGNAPTTKERKVYFKNVQAVKTTTMFVAAFFCCWLPYSLVSIVAILCASCGSNIPGRGQSCTAHVWISQFRAQSLFVCIP